MTWNFERVAAFQGTAGGLAWDGKTMLVAAVKEERIDRFDPQTGKVSDFRRYTGRTNGIAVGPNGSVFGAQEGGRRTVEFRTDGSTAPTCDLLDGKHHNQPTDVLVDRSGRVWIADAYNVIPPYGPPVYPFLDHASVLRLERSGAEWKITRITHDTQGVRAIALSPDEKTLYVAEGDPDRPGPREVRAYPVNGDGSVGKCKVLLELSSSDRGIEGLTVDSDGNVIACGGSAKSGPGATVYVLSAAGSVVEKHAAPADLPMRCAFGDSDLSSLYLTTGGGELFRAKNAARRGVKR